jgi:hypothetical protein
LAKHGKNYGVSVPDRGSLRNFSSTFGVDKKTGLLLPLAYRAFVFHKDDFFKFDSSIWTTATDTGATAFAFNAQANGAARGSTGTTANNYAGMLGPRIFLGDKLCGVAFRFKISAVTNVNFEMGFVDALTDGTLPAVSDVDVPTVGNGAGDVAVIHLDTSQTLKTAALVTKGSTSGMSAVKTNLGTWAPSATTWYWGVVQLDDGDNVHAFVIDAEGDSILAQAHTSATVNHKIEGGTLVRPHFIGGTRNTTNKDYDIDAIVLWQER